MRVCNNFTAEWAASALLGLHEAGAALSLVAAGVHSIGGQAVGAEQGPCWAEPDGRDTGEESGEYIKEGPQSASIQEDVLC